jgi:ATPase subunit of ABC transporter with duplicated ATPase domains
MRSVFSFMKRQDLERKHLRVLEKSILDYEAQLFFVSHDAFILNQAVYANFLMKRRCWGPKTATVEIRYHK